MNVDSLATWVFVKSVQLYTASLNPALAAALSSNLPLFVALSLHNAKTYAIKNWPADTNVKTSVTTALAGVMSK